MSTDSLVNVSFFSLFLVAWIGFGLKEREPIYKDTDKVIKQIIWYIILF